MLLVKKFIFFLYLFSVKIRLETRFNSILDRKETSFLDFVKKKCLITNFVQKKISFLL